MSLEDHGYKVIEAVNGYDAIEKFRENMSLIDLVLLDVIMPVKNGKEAFAVIRKLRPRTRTIFMSGYSDDILAEKGILQEGINFVSKPINPDCLMHKIRDVLDSRPVVEAADYYSQERECGPIIA